MVLKLDNLAYGLLLTLSLSGCGSSSQSTATDQQSTGVFIDSAVSGLEYITSSDVSGITDENGTFKYNSGDTITFSMGSIVLGSATASDVLTPYSLFTQNSEHAVNLAQLLITLDADQNPDNGIDLINSVMLDGIQSESVDFTSPAFDANMQSFTAIGQQLVSDAVATAHLDSSLAAISISSGIDVPANGTCSVEQVFDLTPYQTTTAMLVNEFSYDDSFDLVNTILVNMEVNYLEPSIYAGSGDCEGDLLDIIDVTIADVSTTRTVNGEMTSYADGVMIYLKAEAAGILQNSASPSVSIYIDTDGNANTGYSVKDIGADYLFETQTSSNATGDGVLGALQQWNQTTNAWDFAIYPETTDPVYAYGESGYSISSFISEIYIKNNNAYINALIYGASSVVVSVENADETGAVTTIFDRTSSFHIGYPPVPAAP